MTSTDNNNTTTTTVHVHFVNEQTNDEDGTFLRFRSLDPDKNRSDEILVATVNLVAFVPEQADTFRLLSVRPAEDPKNLPVLEDHLIVHNLPDHISSKYGQTNFLPSATRNANHHVTVIVSLASGSRLAASFCDSIVSRLSFLKQSAAKTNLTIDHTSSATSIREFCQQKYIPQANQGVYQDLILLSGDGGVVDLINAFHSAPRSETYIPPRLHILPFGTGNALANSYNCNNDNTWGLSALLRGSAIRPLPVIRITFSPDARLLTPETHHETALPVPQEDAGKSDPNPVLYAAVVFSWGLHASLVSDSDTTAYRRFGSDRFLMAAKALVYGQDPKDPSKQTPDYKATYSGQVSYRTATAAAAAADTEFPGSDKNNNDQSDMSNDDKGIDGWNRILRATHSYILATLVSNLEKTFTISPHSRSLDGKLRLVDIPPLSGDEFMAIANAAYDGGKHVGMEYVGYTEVEGLRIEFRDDQSKSGSEDGGGQVVCVDGMIVRVEKGGWVRVQREDETRVEIAHFPPATAATP